MSLLEPVAEPMSERIIIMHVVHSLDIGGLENGVVNLINNLNHELFEHKLCCIKRSGPLAERISRPGIEIIEMRSGEGNQLTLPFRLARLFREKRPDIVHTRNWGTVDAIIGAKLAGTRTIIHGEHGREYHDIEGKNARRNLIRRMLSYLVDRYIVVSDELKLWLIEKVGVPARKVTKIVNGVDVEKFNDRDKRAARRRFGYGDGLKIIGTVGRLDPVKGQRYLIAAFAELQRRHPNALLLIVGDGPCRSELETLAGSLSIGHKILFTGERQDIPDLLKAMDLFVLPSLAEGISNTILEAMATGLPVVATRVGGNPELVADGLTGLLVPKGDSGALASAIAQYLLSPDLMKRHGTAARERAISRFALSGMIDAYQKLYLSTARGKFYASYNGRES